MKGKPISSSTGISVKPPTGFSVSGDQEVVPENKNIRKATDEEKFIAQLTMYTQFLKEQLEFVTGILESAQARNGCKGCGDK